MYYNLRKSASPCPNRPNRCVHYQDFNKFMKELYEAYPNNVEFKGNLATSYQYLGNAHIGLGDLGKGLPVIAGRAALQTG